LELLNVRYRSHYDVSICHTDSEFVLRI